MFSQTTPELDYVSQIENIKNLILEKVKKTQDPNNIETGETHLHQAVSLGHAGLVKELMDANSNPHLLNLQMETPLSSAIKNNAKDYLNPQLDIATVMIMHPQFVLDNNVGIALLRAIETNNLAMAEFLIDKLTQHSDAKFVGAELKKSVDHAGNTVLHLAIEKHPQFIRALVNIGADPTQKNNDDLSSIDKIYIKFQLDDSQELFKRLKLKNESPKTLELGLKKAVEKNNVEAVSQLIDLGADVNVFSNILQIAYKIKKSSRDKHHKHDDRIIRLLLNAPSFRITSHLGSIIGSSVKDEDIDLLKLLLGKAHSQYTLDKIKHILNNTFLNQDRDTALHCAVNLNHGEMVELLLAYGADPFQVNNKNESPFSIARETGHFENVYLYVLQNSQDPEDKSKHKKFSVKGFNRIKALADKNLVAKRLLADIHFKKLAPSSFSPLTINNDNTLTEAREFYSQIASKDPYASMMIDIINGEFFQVKRPSPGWEYLYDPNLIQITTFYNAIRAVRQLPSRAPFICEYIEEVAKNTKQPRNLILAAIATLDAIEKTLNSPHAPDFKMIDLLNRIINKTPGYYPDVSFYHLPENTEQISHFGFSQTEATISNQNNQGYIEPTSLLPFSLTSEWSQNAVHPHPPASAPSAPPYNSENFRF